MLIEQQELLLVYKAQRVHRKYLVDKTKLMRRKLSKADANIIFFLIFAPLIAGIIMVIQQ